MDFTTNTVCVVDNGIFAEVARSLSKRFGKVYYTSPWVADFPSSYKTELGEGFPDFERVDDIWDIIDDVDLFVFTDLHQGTLQEYLASKGKRVFGSRNADELECYRTDAKEHFAGLSIPQAPYVVVTGMSALRKYIKSRGNTKLWIKIDKTRGDTETFSVEGYDLAKNRLDFMEAEFGPIAEQRDFVVEDNLPDTLDIAIDTYSIDGKYPAMAMLGVEQKDMGYVGAVKPWAAMPPTLVDIYEKLSPTLESYQYRNLFALESRVGKGGLWLADPCCRFGSPVSELELDLITNLPEIMWEGANGMLVEPIYKAKYGCEVLIKSQWSPEKPMLIEFPAEYRNQVKLRYAAQFGNETWILPQNSGEEVGAVVAYGSSLEDCMEEVSEIGKQIKGTQLTVTTGSMDDLKENLKDLASWGIDF
jgi:hypothetical protein